MHVSSYSTSLRSSASSASKRFGRRAHHHHAAVAIHIGLAVVRHLGVRAAVLHAVLLEQEALETVALAVADLHDLGRHRKRLLDREQTVDVAIHDGVAVEIDDLRKLGQIKHAQLGENAGLVLLRQLANGDGRIVDLVDQTHKVEAGRSEIGAHVAIIEQLLRQHARDRMRAVDAHQRHAQRVHANQILLDA
jgi:hypothetical protein